MAKFELRSSKNKKNVFKVSGVTSVVLKRDNVPEEFINEDGETVLTDILSTQKLHTYVDGEVSVGEFVELEGREGEWEVEEAEASNAMLKLAEGAKPSIPPEWRITKRGAK